MGKSNQPELKPVREQSRDADVPCSGQRTFSAKAGTGRQGKWLGNLGGAGIQTSVNTVQSALWVRFGVCGKAVSPGGGTECRRSSLCFSGSYRAGEHGETREMAPDPIPAEGATACAPSEALLPVCLFISDSSPNP